MVGSRHRENLRHKTNLMKQISNREKTAFERRNEKKIVMVVIKFFVLIKLARVCQRRQSFVCLHLHIECEQKFMSNTRISNVAEPIRYFWELKQTQNASCANGRLKHNCTCTPCVAWFLIEFVCGDVSKLHVSGMSGTVFGLEIPNVSGINGVKCEKCFATSMSKLRIEMTHICPHQQWQWICRETENHRMHIAHTQKKESPKFHSHKTNHPKIQWVVAIATVLIFHGNSIISRENMCMNRIFVDQWIFGTKLSLDDFGCQCVHIFTEIHRKKIQRLRDHCYIA